MKCVSSLLEPTGRVLLPDALRTQPKKESNRCGALASLRSCQTIPVKALFWSRPEEETLGECKEKRIHRIDRSSCGSLVVGESCKESTRS